LPLILPAKAVKVRCINGLLYPSCLQQIVIIDPDGREWVWGVFAGIKKHTRSPNTSKEQPPSWHGCSTPTERVLMPTCWMLDLGLSFQWKKKPGNYPTGPKIFSELVRAKTYCHDTICLTPIAYPNRWN
jgi:hypothetical protein